MEHLQGDIIRAPALPRQIYQGGTALGGGIVADGHFQLILGDDAPEAVRAKQQIIAVLHRHAAFSAVDGYFPSGTEGGGQNVTLRMPLGILGANHAAFDQPAYVGVIAGETQDFGGAHQVKAAVTNMREVKLPVMKHERGAGGAHSLESGIPLGIIQNPGVGHGKRFHQSCSRIMLETPVINLSHGFNCESASFLAALVSAHAVGDYG